MKTTTLGVGVLAAAVFATLAVSIPTYAQQATSDTARPQIEGSREMKEGGMKRGNKMGGMKVGKEFFEDLSDEQKEEMKAELEGLRGDITKEEIEAMSEEEREGFHIEIQAQRDEIMKKYVDADDLADGSYEVFRVEQEAKRGEMKESGEKRGKKDYMKTSKEFFEDLNEEEETEMKTRIKALKDETTREEIEAMSEEEREIFHTEMKAKKDAIVLEYVDADDLADGSYETFRAEQEANHAERKASGEDGKRGEKKSKKGDTGEKEGKGNVMQKFISYVATMDADQKSELLEKIDGKVEAMMTRIENGDGTDAEKATKIERIESMVEMIKSFLS